MFGEIRNEQGERIDYTFHEGKPDQVVLIGHGVTGNKDRPFLVTLAERLTSAGMSVVRFSFSGNGDSEGRFEDSTVTKEVTDLQSILSVVTGESRRIAYVGHSMGGAVGVLAASQDARIQWLVSLAGMVDTAEFARREFGDVTPGQGCMWDKPECPLSQAYMDDMRAVGSVAELGSRIKIPWLLVHGAADDVVPLQDSRDILSFAGDNAEMVELPDADHVFTGEATTAMCTQVKNWFVHSHFTA